MLAGEIGARNDFHAAAYERARDYIAGQWQAMGTEVDTQPFHYGTATATNLQVTIPGKRPGRIIVGAHYDSCWETPGADDNASAVAVLLEMTRLLLDGMPRPTVELVAYANEEPPHFRTDTMGSRVHAKALAKQRGEVKVHGMLCLEMLGYYLTEPNSQPYPFRLPRPLRWMLPTRGDFIALLTVPTATSFLARFRLAMGVRGGRRGLPKVPMWSLPLPERVGDGAHLLSDHQSYLMAGFPAIMATDTSFVRNPHYHQPSDLPQSLDYERMATTTLRLARGVRRFR